MATIMEPITKCQKCGGPVWDNRAKKRDGTYKANASDFACKDKEGCGESFWIGEPKDGKVVPKAVTTPVHTRSVFTVGALAEKMNEAYEALQVAGFGTDLITIDVTFKMAFTELKGRNPGD